MANSRRDPFEPLLRDVVLVRVIVDNAEDFDALMTRVPGLGEQISREDRIYRILEVQHEPINEDGRARAGWHAFVDATLLPSEE